MEAHALHDLTAAYALDALGADEQREYEAHLARCEHCRGELGSLLEAATALAFGVEAPAPPAQLRARILERAHAERSNVVPLRPRWAIPVAATAVTAVAAAIALAIWAASLSSKVDRLQTQRQKSDLVAAVIAAPGARHVGIGDRGMLVVDPTARGVLVLRDLRPAHRGMLYEAWVADHGPPKPAGTFESAGAVTAVLLEQGVPKGASVLVTEEPHRVDAPTSKPFLAVTA